MATEVRARYANGKFEPLNLKEGYLVTRSVTDEEPARETVSLANICERLRASVPPCLRASVPDVACASLPTDLVRNEKHHLCGHPKVEN